MSPSSQQSILTLQVQRTMSVLRGKQECTKPQTLTRATTTSYRVMGVPLIGSNMIHDPIDHKTVSQHLTRFWTLTCFDNSRWLRTNLDVKPKSLVSLSNYLSMQLWIVENRVYTLLSPSQNKWRYGIRDGQTFLSLTIFVKNISNICISI